MITALEYLLERARGLPPHQSLDTDPSTLPEALQLGAFVVDWRALRDDELHATSNYNVRSSTVDDEYDDEHGDEDEEGVDKMSVSALASSSAAFWQRMLRQRFERLKHEDAEAAAEAGGDEGFDRSGSAGVPSPPVISF